MNVRINGQTEVVPAGCTVLDYLVSKGTRPEIVAVELNMNVLDKKSYSETPLSDGDVVEIVRFVGGG